MSDRLFILRIKNADALSEDEIKQILEWAEHQPSARFDVETGPEVVERRVRRLVGKGPMEWKRMYLEGSS